MGVGIFPEVEMMVASFSLEKGRGVGGLSEVERIVASLSFNSLFNCIVGRLLISGSSARLRTGREPACVAWVETFWGTCPHFPQKLAFAGRLAPQNSHCSINSYPPAKGLFCEKICSLK